MKRAETSLEVEVETRWAEPLTVWRVVFRELKSCLFLLYGTAGPETEVICSKLHQNGKSI